jgi:hypothetical protein
VEQPRELTEGQRVLLERSRAHRESIIQEIADLDRRRAANVSLLEATDKLIAIYDGADPAPQSFNRPPVDVPSTIACAKFENVQGVRPCPYVGVTCPRCQKRYCGSHMRDHGHVGL